MGLFSLFLLFQISLFAIELHESTIHKLAYDKTWLRLLHYEKETMKSDILDSDFFLSPQGNSDPASELQALIQNYSTQWSDNPNSDPRCRFPARYYWLSQKLHLPDYTIVPPQCEKLNRWGLFKRADSISVLLVSGYLGNPASTFGHSMLKLDTPDENDDLFDLSINYGALIPEGELTPVYIFRGLTGGYVAGYSDRYFYTQDMTYSHTEFRDIWSYKLNFSKEKRTLLILHIWEMVGRKKRYFFLTKNCGYEIAKLLEVSMETDLTDHANIWYAPVELFNRLEDMDKKARLHKREPLIKSISYLPSSQRKLIRRYDMLDNESKEAANRILYSGSLKKIDSILVNKQSKQKIKLLDFLLAYQQYRFIKEQPSPKKETISFKNAILAERLKLPPSKQTKLDIHSLPPPSKGARPSIFHVGIGYRKSIGNHLQGGIVAYSQESTGLNSLAGDELVVLDLSIGIKSKIFLDKIDYLKIRKFSVGSLPGPLVQKLSWNLNVTTLKDERTAHRGKYDHSLCFGAGKAFALNEGKIYAMVDFSAHSLSPHIRTMPKIGLYNSATESLKTLIEAGLINDDSSEKFRPSIKIDTQYTFSPHFSLSLNVEKRQYIRSFLHANWRW